MLDLVLLPAPPSAADCEVVRMSGADRRIGRVSSFQPTGSSGVDERPRRPGTTESEKERRGVVDPSAPSRASAVGGRVGQVILGCL